MVSESQMSAAVLNYIDGFARSDTEALTQLFAETAVIEDPVGAPPLVGRAAIRQFYARICAGGAKLTLTGPIRTTGRHAAFPFQSRVTYKGVPCTIDIIDVFRFDDEGRIEAMQAFFGASNIVAD
jgi:steroid delta-isomerase